MQTRQNEHLEDLGSSMTFLASIGANAPFIGLFGTVWGIMIAFVGIAKSQTTSLAVVAPGIAGALLATAAGLAAAIPAVLIYNFAAKQISKQGQRSSTTSLRPSSSRSSRATWTAAPVEPRCNLSFWRKIAYGG